MMRRICAAAAIALTVFLGMSNSAGAFPVISSGNLVVVQVGLEGGGTLSSAATPVALREFTTLGLPVQQINMPSTAATSGNRALTMSGTATSEGALTLSANGQYLMLAGYNENAGVASVASGTVSRVVGRVDLSGNADTTTAFASGGAYSGNNIRGAASSDGIDIWASGPGGTSSGGVRYTTFGSSTATLVSGAATNTRVVDIYGGQLYASASAGAFVGVNKVGTNLPTSADTTTLLIPTTGSGGSSYAFWFSSPTVAYIADDSGGANGGIQKWTFNGSNWSLAYVLGVGGAGGGTSARGLAGTVVNGQTVLYATTTETSANRLIEITDLGSAAASEATLALLATAPTNTVFRGVELVPEPTSLLLFAIGGLLAIRRRR